MTTLPQTLLIRQTKHSAKRGIPAAVAYRTNVYDPASALEAIIEAYGADNVKRFIDTIQRRRESEMAEYPENFKRWEL